MKRFKLVVFLIMIAAFLSIGAGNPRRCIKTKCIGVMSAFNSELSILLEETQDKREYSVLGRTVTTGELRGHDVVLGLSGVSMTNAAMVPQAWFGKFKITHLIFSGIAGGVNPDIHIGDVVVPAQWSPYQEFRFCREVDGEFGCTSDLPNYGMMFPASGVRVCTVNGPRDECERRRWFQVDPDMLEAAELAASKTELAQCGLDRDGNEVCLDQQPIIKIGGNGVAGPTFVDNADFRIWAWNAYQTDTLDMETAATAQVAYANGIPFLAFRSASDLAGGGPGENQISTFFGIAAGNSAVVLLAFLEEWK